MRPRWCSAVCRYAVQQDGLTVTAQSEHGSGCVVDDVLEVGIVRRRGVEDAELDVSLPKARGHLLTPDAAQGHDCGDVRCHRLIAGRL